MQNESMRKGNLYVIKGYASENFKILPFLRLVFTTQESCITVSFKWYQSPFLHFTYAKFDDNCKFYDYDYC